MIKYGPNDTKQIKKETSYIYALLWYKFLNDFVGQGDFGKRVLLQKIY